MIRNNQMLSTLWTLVMRNLNTLIVEFGRRPPRGESQLKVPVRGVPAKSTSPLDLNNLSSIFKQKATKTPAARPVKYLPNVRRFLIKGLSEFHPILSKAGIQKRSAAPIIESENYRNGRLNRYVQYQVERLNNNRSNPIKF